MCLKEVALLQRARGAGNLRLGHASETDQAVSHREIVEMEDIEWVFMNWCDQERET